VLSDPAVRASVEACTPLGRVAQPEEISGAPPFLFFFFP